MNFLFNKSYYKIRIIVTFCGITILIVLILSFLSYNFVKKLYLDQLSEQVNLITKIISRQIDERYLNLLQVGTPTKSTAEYFKSIFSENLKSGIHSRIFIFDKNLQVLINSDSEIASDNSEPLLLLNQKEILNLKPEASTVSVPFKGDDGKWYLWGFLRLDNYYWLALKENAAKLERVEKFASDFFCIGLAAVLLTVAIGLFMARSLTKPIDRLVEFSKEIGSGNFIAPIPKNTHGELKILARSMDKMKNDIEANNKEKEKMLAQIAHEIRNPLGGIELLANLTKEDLMKENILASASVEYLAKIISEVNSLKCLITSYLNFSRPLSPNPEWIPFDLFLKEIYDDSKANLIKKNLKFSFNTQLEKIWFDKAHLKQIFINLMTNSLESLDYNGNIIVSAFEKDKKWYIIVSDDGPGIDVKHLEQVFEPFFTTKKDGTGLGLAICKKLCSENKAELKVENNQGKGSSFTIIKEAILV